MNDLKTKLRMKCRECGHWNSFPANKIFIEQATSEPKVKACMPMYDPLEVVRCKKCGTILAEPRTLIRIVRTGK
jgi:RNase P subunit RPR2